MRRCPQATRHLPKTEIKRQEEVIVQCDICGEEVDNSEDLAMHKEKFHAVAESGEAEEPEEKEEPEDVGIPEPGMIPPR